MKDTVTFRRTISIKGDKATVITESKIKLLKNLSLNIQSFLIKEDGWLTYSKLGSFLVGLIVMAFGNILTIDKEATIFFDLNAYIVNVILLISGILCMLVAKISKNIYKNEKDSLVNNNMKTIIETLENLEKELD